jgi:hypothetical protein
MIFNEFPKYHMKILSGDFNAKVGREDIFNPKAGGESLHEISNDNEVKAVNLPHPKIQESKVQCSRIITFIKLLGHVLMGRHINILIMLWHVSPCVGTVEARSLESGT